MSLDIFFLSPGKAMNQSVSLRHSGLSKMTKGIGVTSLPSKRKNRQMAKVSKLYFSIKLYM